MKTLAVKYRPTTFEDVVSQHHIITILKRQLENNALRNCYMITGSSGVGKTTIARIFANEINKGQGSPIEIDGASNNGVDNIRAIIEDSRERSIDSKYKVYIIDEAHMLTIQAWNAFLKCLEEPSNYTIFILCTTNPEKIPETILNRVMEFKLNRLTTTEITNRLLDIVKAENIGISYDSIYYISSISNGSLREALTLLDKVKDYNGNIVLDQVIEVVGGCPYDILFDLTNAIIDGDEQGILEIIEYIYNKGKNLNMFINQYLDFIIDLLKYCIFKKIDVLSMPKNIEGLVEKLNVVTGIENNTSFFNNLLINIFELKRDSSDYANLKNLIIIAIVKTIRGY